MRSALIVGALLGGASAASAAGLGVEIRGGVALSGLETTDDLADPFTNGQLDNASVDLFFGPAFNPLFLLQSPRVAAGVVMNFGDGENFGHAGLNWQVGVPFTPAYVEAGIGAAMVVESFGVLPPTDPSLVCDLRGYAEAGVGVGLGENFSATLTGKYATPASLCGGDSEPLTSVGVALGLRF